MTLVQQLVFRGSQRLPGFTESQAERRFRVRRAVIGPAAGRDGRRHADHLLSHQKPPFSSVANATHAT